MNLQTSQIPNYLELLEDARAFSQMDKTSKAQMLSSINELIKRDHLWVLNSRNDESKRRIRKALCDRLWADVLADILSDICQRDFAIFSVFGTSVNERYPKELKNARKCGDIDFALAFSQGKDYEFRDIFGKHFIVFARNSSFDLHSFISKLAKTYSWGIYAYAKNAGNFTLYNAFENLEFPSKIKLSKLINFYSNCKVDLDALKELCPNPSKSLSIKLTCFKALFYERLSDEILGANRQIIGSITGYTARSLWFDNYDKSVYIKTSSINKTKICL